MAQSQAHAASSDVALMQALTESLRLLSLEARKKQPVIKEAAERAILRVRNFLTRHKPLTSKTVEAALQPLLLTVNHQNADEKLLTIAIGAIQKLALGTDLTTNQLQNVVRVLGIQAEGGSKNIQLRVLQTLPLLLSPSFFQSDDSLMATVIGIECFLIQCKDPMIRHTATGILRQSVTVLFDTLQLRRDLLFPATECSFPKKPLPAVARTAVLFFRDLCILGNHTTTTKTKSNSGAGSVENLPLWIATKAPVSHTLAMELLADILTSPCAGFLAQWNVFYEIVSTSLCPLLSRNLTHGSERTVLCHTMTCVQVVLRRFMRSLPQEAKVLFSLLFRELIPPPGIGPGSIGNHKIHPNRNTSSSTLSGTDTRPAAPGSEGSVVRGRESDTIGTVREKTSSAVRATTNFIRRAFGRAPLSNAASSEMSASTATIRGSAPTGSPSKTSWRCVLVLEVLRSLSKVPRFGSDLYQIYDCTTGMNDALGPLLIKLAEFTAAALSAVTPLAIDDAAKQHRRRQDMTSMLASEPFTADSASKSQRGNSTSPQTDDSLAGDAAYMVLIATDCVINLLCSIPLAAASLEVLEPDVGTSTASSASCALSTSESAALVKGNSTNSSSFASSTNETPLAALNLQRGLFLTMWAPGSQTIESVAEFCSEVEFIQRALKAYEHCVALSVNLELHVPLDGLLVSLSSLAFPAAGSHGKGAWKNPRISSSLFDDALGVASSASTASQSAASAPLTAVGGSRSGGVDHSNIVEATQIITSNHLRRHRSHQHGPKAVTRLEAFGAKHIQALKTQLNLALSLGDQLPSSTWDLLLGVFEHLHIALQSQSAKGLQFEAELDTLHESLLQIFECSASLSNSSVMRLLDALRRQLPFDMTFLAPQRSLHTDHATASAINAEISTPNSSEQNETRARMRRLAMHALGAAVSPPTASKSSPELSRSPQDANLSDDAYDLAAIESSATHRHTQNHSSVSSAHDGPSPSTMLLPREWFEESLPFAALMFVATVRANMHRIEIIWKETAHEFLIALVHGSRQGTESNASVHNGAVMTAYLSMQQAALLREFAVSTATEWALAALVSAPATVGPILKMLRLFLNIATDPAMGVFAFDTHDGATASAALAVKVLDAIRRVVDDGGLSLLPDDWEIILNTLAHAAAPDENVESRGGGDLTPGPAVTISTAGLASSVPALLVSTGFKCISSVVDDHLDHLSPQGLIAVGKCLGAYGAQQADVNIGLTAINEILTLVDFVKQVSTNGILIPRHRELDALSKADQASSPTYSSESDAPRTQLSLPLRERLWRLLLQLLQKLSCDERASIRNSSLQTLSLAIQSFYAKPRAQVERSAHTIAHSPELPEALWRVCLEECLLPLLQYVQARRDRALKAGTSNGGGAVQGDALGTTASGQHVRMVVHHSRDTVAKQWNETIAIALKVSTRVVQSYFSRLVVVFDQKNPTASTAASFSRRQAPRNDEQNWFIESFWKQLLSCLVNGLCPAHARLAMHSRDTTEAQTLLSSMDQSLIEDREVELAALGALHDLTRFFVIHTTRDGTRFAGSATMADVASEFMLHRSSLTDNVGRRGDRHTCSKGTSLADNSTAAAAALILARPQTAANGRATTIWDVLATQLLDVYSMSLPANAKVVQDDDEVLAAEFFKGATKLFAAPKDDGRATFDGVQGGQQACAGFWTNARIQHMLNICNAVASAVHSRSNTRRTSHAGMAMNFGRMTPSEKSYLAFLQSVAPQVVTTLPAANAASFSGTRGGNFRTLPQFWCQLLCSYFSTSSTNHQNALDRVPETVQDGHLKSRETPDSPAGSSKYTLAFSRQTMELAAATLAQLRKAYDQRHEQGNAAVPVSAAHARARAALAEQSAIAAVLAVNSSAPANTSERGTWLGDASDTSMHNFVHNSNINGIGDDDGGGGGGVVGEYFLTLVCALTTPICPEGIARSLEAAALKAASKKSNAPKIDALWVAAAAELSALATAHFDLALVSNGQSTECELSVAAAKTVWTFATRTLAFLEGAERAFSKQSSQQVSPSRVVSSRIWMSPKSIEAEIAARSAMQSVGSSASDQDALRDQVAATRTGVLKALINSTVASSLRDIKPELVPHVVPAVASACLSADPAFAIDNFWLLIKLAGQTATSAATLPTLMELSLLLLHEVALWACTKHGTDWSFSYVSLLPEPDIKARLAAVLDMLTNAEFRQEDFQGCFSEGKMFTGVSHTGTKYHLHYLSDAMKRCLAFKSLDADTRWSLQQALTRLTMGVGLVDKAHGSTGSHEQAF